MIHVRDMAMAVVAVLEAPQSRIHAEAFNVGATDANYIVRDLAAIVAEVLVDVRVEFADGAGGDARSYRVDFSKIADTLEAFRPVWSADSGARELADAYLAAGLDEEMFSSDRFVRLARLKSLIGDGLLDGDLRWRSPR